MNVRAYAVAIVLAVWTLVSAAGLPLVPFMLAVMTWAVVITAGELGGRYRDVL